MHGYAADVIHAWRRLRAAPRFTLFSIVVNRCRLSSRTSRVACRSKCGAETLVIARLISASP